MAHFLVLSERHGLAPIAWRLQREGHTVDSMSRRPRFDKAWAGALTSSIKRPERKGDFAAALEPWHAAHAAGELTILHDSEGWQRHFPDAHFQTTMLPAGNPSTPVRLGAWFTGEEMVCPHLLVEDRGAWPGGQGPPVAGALTLVRPTVWPTVFATILGDLRDAVKSAGHRGLVQVSIVVSPEGEVTAVGWEGGWTRLHGHAFVAALGTAGMPLGDVLLGGEPVLAHRFSIVAPVTVPPWPLPDVYPANQCNVASHEVAIGALSSEAQANLMFHDVRVDREAKQLWVAGLDGLVAVARGVGEVWELALARLRTLAESVVVPERQWRIDAGSAVPGVLATLESVGLGVL